MLKLSFSFVLTVLCFTFCGIMPGMKANAAAGPVNESCTQARLQKLQFKGITRYKEFDYCREPDSTLNPRLLAFIHHIAKINSRFASELGYRNIRELLGKKMLSMTIVSSRLGSYDSFDGGAIIQFSAFKEFELSQFSDFVYLHELTHAIFSSDFPLGSSAKQVIDQDDDDAENYGLLPFSEAISDVAAALTLNQTRLSLKDLPARSCLQKIEGRDGSPLTSMAQMFSSFDVKFFSSATLPVCCAEIDANPESSENERAVCREYEHPSLKDELGAEMKNRGISASTRFDVDLSTPFEAKLCFENDNLSFPAMKQNGRCDAHLFTPAFISFFTTLKRSIAHPLLPSFLRALQTTKSDFDQYRCSFPEAKNPVFQVMPVRSLKHVFDDWRDSLPKSDQKAYKEAFANHRLDLFFDFSAQYERSKAEWSYVYEDVKREQKGKVACTLISN